MVLGLSVRRGRDQHRPAPAPRARRWKRKLSLEALEDRRLLAAFGESGVTLDLVMNSGEFLSILSTASDTYTFTLTSGGPWSGTDSERVTGTGTNMLTVTPAGKAALDTIRITDAGGVAGVAFADSGGNAYTDNLSIQLTDGSAAVTFQGASAFGTSDLEVSTQGNIVLAGVSPVGQISVSDGNIALSANSAGTSPGSFTGIRLATGSSITSTGIGHIRLIGRGAGTLDDSCGIIVEAGAVIRSTSITAPAGTILLDGTGGAGANNNDGMRVSGTNAGVKSVAGAIQITGTAPAGGFGLNLQSNRAVESSGPAVLELMADSVNLAGVAPVVAAAASSVWMRPRTVGIMLDLGGKI